MINVTDWKKQEIICSYFQMGKSCKLSFNISSNTTQFLIEKLYCDLWGPAPITSYQNFRYYAIIIDDFFSYSWIISLRNKSYFFDNFFKLQRLIENRFDRKIKIFQSDGGGEFTSTRFEEHLQQCGISH